MKYYIHPEVHREVKAQFDKLHKSYPEVDGWRKWNMAKKYVAAQASADTALIMLQIRGEQ